MHSLFELLLISFSIASSRVVRAYDLLPDNVDFTPYVKENYFDTQRDDGKLLSDLTVDLESRALGGLSLNELFARQMRSDLQTFTGAVGGIKAPSITQSNNQERPYQVEGNTFPNYMEAATRTCDIQKNDCADMVNAQSANGGNNDQSGNQDGDGADDQLQLPQPTTTARTSTASQTLQNAVLQSSKAQQQNSQNGQDATTAASSSRTSSTRSSATSARQGNSGGNQQQGNNQQGNNRQGNDEQGSNNGNGTANANNRQRRQNSMTMQMCEQQLTQCNQVVRTAAVQSFNMVNLGPDPNDPDFDLLCSA